MKTNTSQEEYLHSIKVNFEKYKIMGDKTFEQLEDKDYQFSLDEGF